MNTNTQRVLLLVGRLLFGGYFVYSGFRHFTSLEGLVGATAARGIPGPEVMVIVTGAMMVLGGLAVVFGIAPRAGLVLIVAFLLPAAFLMHAFWAEADAQGRTMQLGFFLRNLTFTGAALALMALPVPWPWSLGEASFRSRRTVPA